MQYILVQNLMYNVKHVKKFRWYHKVFGLPNLAMTTVHANSKEEAIAKFIKQGFNMGILHEHYVSQLTHKKLLN